MLPTSARNSGPSALRPFVWAAEISEKSGICEKRSPSLAHPERRIGMAARVPVRLVIQNHETESRHHRFGQSKIIALRNFQRFASATLREFSQKLASGPGNAPYMESALILCAHDSAMNGGLWNSANIPVTPPPSLPSLCIWVTGITRLKNIARGLSLVILLAPYRDHKKSITKHPFRTLHCQNW